MHFVRGLLCKNGSGLGDVYVNGTVSDNLTWCVDVRMWEDGSSLSVYGLLGSVYIYGGGCACMYVCDNVCSMFVVYVDVSRGGLRGCWVNGSVWTSG